MRLHLAARTAAALSAIWATSACGPSGPPVGPENYTLIARDFVGGLAFIDGSVPPALTSDGRVAFVGTLLVPTTPRPQAIFFGDGTTLTSLGTQAAGYTKVLSVQYASNGDVAFVAERTPGADLLRGAFRTDMLGSTYATLREGRVDWHPQVDGQNTPPRFTLAMSPNGTIAFSTVLEGYGALWRVAPGGVPVALRAGVVGVFTNSSGNAAGEIDVNDAGSVSVQFEYRDPAPMQLRRGVFVFDAPGDDLATSEASVSRQLTSFSAPVAINASGQMAFVLREDRAPTIPINYYVPPLASGAPPSATIAPLQAGVYLATPALFGTPFTYSLIASAANGYSSFGRVDLNDSGVVVFEAQYDGRPGVFSGPDPVVDRVAITDQPMVIGGQRHRFSFIRLGQLNNQNQVTIQTSDIDSVDQMVWRIDNIK